MKNKTIYSLTMSTLILLTGCASYHAGALSMLPQDSSITSKQSSEVLVAWKAFNQKDCQTYLGRDVLSEGYVPVQLTIRNNSNDPMYLSPNHFNIPLSPAYEVASTVHTSTGGRVAAWGVGGLLFFPLLIPAFVDGFKSIHANEKLDADYEAKALKEQTIQPHSSFNGVVFIPKKHADQKIEMFLVNLRTHEKVAFSEIPLSQE
jgi:hypothetical protein